jgi:Response regulators consisting of a CheY-like receiver domain and a winged-helix DNA-binding domain
MQKIFARKNAGVSEDWRWHNSYRVMYRLVNCKREEIKVLEWGNLLSLNGNFIVNSFVTPLDELEVLDVPSPELATFLDSSANESFALLDDCGIHIGNILLIYPRRHKLFVNGKAVALTPIEFELLLVLAAHLNKTLNTKEIYKNLWDKEDLNVTSFTLKTHVSNLRKKLCTASNNKIQLKNCKGDGYCLLIEEL